MMQGRCLRLVYGLETMLLRNYESLFISYFVQDKIKASRP